MKRNDITSVYEAKKVLDFLSVDKSQFEDINDFETLLNMVCEQESKLIDKVGVGLTIEHFKEIFNTFLTTEERKDELQKLFNYVMTSPTPSGNYMFY